MTLKIQDGDTFKDVVIGEGHIYLHPARVPHSPQRNPDTVGTCARMGYMCVCLCGVCVCLCLVCV